MRTLSRIGVVSLFAVAAFLVGGAAAGDAHAATSARPAMEMPDRAAAGQTIDIDITCESKDKKARVQITGDHVSVGTSVPLKDGKTSLSVRVTPLGPEGTYEIELTCQPSDLKASTTITVTE